MGGKKGTHHQGGVRGARRKMRNGEYKYMFFYYTPEWAFTKWPELNLKKETRYPGGLTDSPKDAQANAWMDEELDAIKRGTWEPLQIRQARREQQSITFAQYSQQWLESRVTSDGTPLRSTTKKKYEESLRLYLLPFFGAMPMVSITHKDVSQWLSSFTPVSGECDLENRRYHVYKHLKAIMKSAAEEAWEEDGTPLIARYPCLRKCPQPKVKHETVRPTAQQFEAFKQALPAWAAFIAEICDVTGVRQAEALALTMRDVDFKARRIHITKQAQYENGHVTAFPPKTGESRDVAITSELADAIQQWITANGITDKNAPLVRAPRSGGYRSPQSYRRAISVARKQIAGMETIRGHDLRKDGLSRMGENGASVAEIMAQGGHKSMEVASVYQKPDTSHLQSVMDNIQASRHVNTQKQEIALTLTDGADADLAASLIDSCSDSEIASILEDMGSRQRLELLKVLPIDRCHQVMKISSIEVKAALLRAMTEKG